MKRFLAAILLTTAVAGVGSAQPKLPDFTKASQDRDWRGLLAHYQVLRKGTDAASAADAYQLAWDAAMFWAAYDPASWCTTPQGIRGSGTRRADGVTGLREIIKAGPPNPSWAATFQSADDLLNPPAGHVPQVLSGGARNEGLWRLANGPAGGGTIVLTQQNSRVSAAAADPAGKKRQIDLGQQAFDGRQLRVDIRDGKTRLNGTLQYREEGTGVLVGDLTLARRRFKAMVPLPAWATPSTQTSHRSS